MTPTLSTYTDAALAVTGLTARIGSGRWPGPGLGEWDLRTLVGHTSRALTNVLVYVDRPATVEDIPSAEAYYTLDAAQTGEGEDTEAVHRLARDSGDALGVDPAASFGRLAAQVIDRLSTADPDDLVQSVAGGIRLGAYVATRTVELVVHGFDIAAATGLPVSFPPPTLKVAAAVVARTGVELGHGPSLLAALTGRGPLPAHFSAVT